MDTRDRSGVNELAPEEAGRLAVYSFLARALARPVSRDDLDFLSPMAGTASPLNAAIGDFCAAVEATENSRLSCQIKVSDELDGLVVRMPEFQS